jgi:hypothetical protein
MALADAVNTANECAAGLSSVPLSSSTSSLDNNLGPRSRITFRLVGSTINLLCAHLISVNIAGTDLSDAVTDLLSPLGTRTILSSVSSISDLHVDQRLPPPQPPPPRALKLPPRRPTPPVDPPRLVPLRPPSSHLRPVRARRPPPPTVSSTPLGLGLPVVSILSSPVHRSAPRPPPPPTTAKNGSRSPAGDMLG